MLIDLFEFIRINIEQLKHSYSFRTRQLLPIIIFKFEKVLRFMLTL